MWLLGVRYTDGAFLYLNPAPRSTTTDEYEHYAYRRPQIRSIEPYDPDSILDDSRTPRRKNQYEDDEQPRTLAEFQSFVNDEYWHYKTMAVPRFTEKEVLSCDDYPASLADLVDERGVDGGHLLGTTTYNAAYYVTDEGDRFRRFLKLREDTVVQIDAPRRHQRCAHHRVPADSQVWRGAFIAQVQTYPDHHGWCELTDVGEACLAAYLDHTEDSFDSLMAF